MEAVGSVDTEHPEPMMAIFVGSSNIWRWNESNALILLHCKEDRGLKITALLASTYWKTKPQLNLW